MWRVLLVAVLLGCGGGSESPQAVSPVAPIVEPVVGHVAEQSDYYDGVLWHRYFRYESGKIGYATSVDGLKFDRYPDPIMDGLFPVLVEDGPNVYLLVNQGSSYNLFDIAVKTKPAFVKMVLYGDHFNVSAAVREGRWHMLVEVKDGKRVHLKYAWSDWPLDFKLGEVVFADCGNPVLRYIPERDAILAFFGRDTGPWTVGAATFDFKAWTLRGFVLAQAGVEIADPDLSVGVEPSPLMLTVGSYQNSVDTYLFKGSRTDLYDGIVKGSVELEFMGTTMRPPG
jgi:hypothetical protein